MSALASLAALTILLLTCAGLSIGLTYAPCYSALCSEDDFPLETRAHVGVFYALLLSLGVCFFLRARFTVLRQFSQKLVCRHRLPLLEAKITYGGVFITAWILFVTLVTTALWLDVIPWWIQHLSALQNASDAAITTAVTGIIGHHVDIILGLVIIPVPRHSSLCEAFGFPSSTLIWAHKALAYLLLIGTVAHGAAYFAFIATLHQNPTTESHQISILNPYVTDDVPSRLGSYALAEFPSGIVLLVLIVIITITALTYFRRRHFEIFYYTHIILGLLFMVFACIHASTNFYCLLPGLVLWVWDWAWRITGGTGLRRGRQAIIEKTENGWIRTTIIPDKDVTVSEKGSSLIDLRPLSTYYINMPEISKAQCHPMSTATSQVNGELQFLFAPCESSGTKRQQWTASVGGVASREDNQTAVHLEGPYFPEIPALQGISHIICVVGGTGITGALSIADWWSRTKIAGQILTIIWTIRDPQTSTLAEWVKLSELATLQPLLQLQLHVTSKCGRMDLETTIVENLKKSDQKTQNSWVYLSGPAGLIRDGEDACLKYQRAFSKDSGHQRLQYYTAIWE